MNSNHATERVLITGAAGFLGSHLCDRFVKDGFQVIAMDNLITGDMRNIEHLLPLPNFSFVHLVRRAEPAFDHSSIGFHEYCPSDNADTMIITNTNTASNEMTPTCD